MVPAASFHAVFSWKVSTHEYSDRLTWICEVLKREQAFLAEMGTCHVLAIKMWNPEQAADVIILFWSDLLWLHYKFW